MAPSTFDWSGNAPPVAYPHTETKQELLARYVQKYIEITAGAAASKPAEVFKFTIIDAFAGGGLFREEYTERRIEGTPLRILRAVEKAKQFVAQIQRPGSYMGPLELDIATHFNDANPTAAAYLQEVLRKEGYDVDGTNVRVTEGKFDAQLDDMIGMVKIQQPRAGKCIFVLDQTGYSQVRPEHIRKIFDELSGSEVILTMAASWMLSPLSGLSTRLALDTKIGGWLLRRDVIDMMQRGESNEQTEAVKLRQVMAELVRETGATGYSCFTLRPHGGNYMWIMHLVRTKRASFARDTMLDIQWQVEQASLHIGGAPADYLGYQGLRRTDPEGSELFRFELAQAERAHLREKYAKSILEQWLSRENLSRVGGVRVEDILRETENRTALTRDDRLRALSELRTCLETKDFEWRNKTGKLIGQRSNRRLDKHDTIHLGRQGSLFGP